MTDDPEQRPFPSKASVAVVSVVAVLGLIGATQVGHRPEPVVTTETVREHLASARDYRAKAASRRQEAERHLMGRGSDAGARATPRQAWFEARCQQLALAAEEQARIEIELAAYHEEQALTLAGAAGSPEPEQ